MRTTRSLFPRRALTGAAVVVVVLSGGGARALAAQATEEQAVMAVVTRLFDGMRARDTAIMRSTFAPGTRLLRAGVRQGELGVAPTAADEFIRIVGSATGPVWDERIHGAEIRIDGTLASVWTAYEFYLGDKFSHCGVDAFHLARFRDGWKIIGLADTQRREGCGQAE